MESGAGQYIFHCQFFFAFKAVDGFVFRTMVLEYPVNLLHTGDAKQVQQENGNTDEPFNDTQRPGRHHGFEKVSQPHRQQEKQQHTQNQGKAHTAINDDVIHAVTQLLLQKFLKLRRLRFLCPIFPSDFR